MNKKFILMPIFFLLMGIAMTAVVMLLWNWLMPTLFGLTIITFWQALGILILSKILFGGHWGKRAHGCPGAHGSHYAWKEKFKSKWQNMPEEDRKKWEEKFCGMKGKRPDTKEEEPNN